MKWKEATTFEQPDFSCSCKDSEQNCKGQIQDHDQSMAGINECMKKLGNHL